MAGGFYRQPLCKRCGKVMKFSPVWGYTPLEVVLYLSQYGFPMESVMHYQCPEQHQRAWYIPTLGDKEQVLVHKDFVPIT